MMAIGDQLMQIVKAGMAEADAVSLREQYLTAAVIHGLLSAVKVQHHRIEELTQKLEAATKPVTPEGGENATSENPGPPRPDVASEPPAPISD